MLFSTGSERHLQWKQDEGIIKWAVQEAGQARGKHCGAAAALSHMKQG